LECVEKKKKVVNIARGILYGSKWKIGRLLSGRLDEKGFY
jgi:hypothetical protein